MKEKIETGENHETKEPVFIVGVPRSGTSLVYSILVRLSEFAGEKDIEWNTETSIFDKYIRHMNNFFKHGERPFWYEYFAGDSIFFERFLIDSCRSFLVNAAFARKSKRILEKTPNHIEHMDFIIKAFPDAKFVHIIRHPVDVYASMRKRALITPPNKDPWLRVSVKEFVQSYKSKITLAFTQGKRILHVKFENLTSNPEHETEKICDFIGTNTLPQKETSLK